MQIIGLQVTEAVIVFSLFLLYNVSCILNIASKCERTQFWQKIYRNFYKQEIKYWTVFPALLTGMTTVRSMQMLQGQSSPST